MLLVLRNCRLNPKCSSFNNWLTSNISSVFSRNISDDNHEQNNQEFTNSTILIESGYNVHELPVIVRKIKDVSELDDKPDNYNSMISPRDSIHNFRLIQTEFKQCIDLRDVFTLLSKCTKITPNIALGAMERIYDLEKIGTPLDDENKNSHINVAKGAILDKLLKVIMKTEDTQTILNILKTKSLFMEPYKYKFSEEILFRVTGGKLFIDQLCEFTEFLITNKGDTKYADAIDKTWIGYVGKEADIDENNIIKIFAFLPDFKVSKKTILNLLEQKLSDLWYRVSVVGMQEILSVFVQEKHSSIESFTIVSKWLYTNIHTLDEDSLLDITTKVTRLKYTDNLIEKAIEKYVKIRGCKIESPILIVGILNYCMEFHVRNKEILNVCCDYFVRKNKSIHHSLLKSFIYPIGYLCFGPEDESTYWSIVEEVLDKNFDKLNPHDVCSIILACIYKEKYPLNSINNLFSAEYIAKVNTEAISKKLHLIDVAMSLDCDKYLGPLLPKDQWSKTVKQDGRIKNIIEKIMSSLISLAGGDDKLSTAVSVPFLCSDELYLIDVMLHPVGLGSSNYNWKLKSAKNQNVVVLIHLPDHYCSDNIQLIGPQVMRKKHMRLLGMRVVSLKYSILSHYYTTCNKIELDKYLTERLSNAETCL